MDKANHIKRIDESIKELISLQVITSPPASTQMCFLGTAITSMIYHLVGVANALDGGSRSIVKGEFEDWLSYMKTIHRVFFSLIHACLELALLEIISQHKIPINVGYNKKIDNILVNLKSVENSNKARKLIEKMKRKNPEFNDHLEAILKNRFKEVKKRKMWRNYFKALSIVRNKSSHSDVTLTSEQKEILLSGGFRVMVSEDGSLVANSRMYKQICDHIIQFLNEFK